MIWAVFYNPDQFYQSLLERFKTILGIVPRKTRARGETQQQQAENKQAIRRVLTVSIKIFTITKFMHALFCV